MPQNLLSQKNSIIGGVVVLALLIGGYFWFSSSSSGSTPQVGMQTSLLNAEVTAFLSAANSIDLKDDSFRAGKNKVLYDDLHDYSVDIPLIPPPGRANPFVPYVAP